VIDAPVEAVFAFHERDDALARLSPSFPRVRVIRKAGGIEAGLRVELRIGPLLWVALHTRYEKNRLFIDEKIQGPFRRWIHRHEFEDLGGSTRLTDRVEYRLRGGPIAEAVFGWLSKWDCVGCFARATRRRNDSVRGTRKGQGELPFFWSTARKGRSFSLWPWASRRHIGTLQNRIGPILFRWPAGSHTGNVVFSGISVRELI